MKALKQNTNIIKLLFAALTLLFMLLLAVQFFLVKKGAGKTAGKAFENGSSQLVQSYSMMLTNRLNMYLREVRFYVDSDVVQTLDTEKIIDWMCSRSGRKNPDIDAMYFCTLDGTAYRDDGSVANFRNEEFFKAIAVDGNYEYISNPKIDFVFKKPVFYVAHVVNVNGKKLGIFAGVYPLSSIQKLVSDIRLGDTGNAWMLADDGTVICYPENGYALKKNFLTGLPSKNNDLREISQNMVNRKTGSGWIKSLGSGNKYFVTYAPVHNAPWSIGLNVSENQYFSSGREFGRIIAVSFVLIFFILSGVLFFIFALLDDSGKKDSKKRPSKEKKN